MIETDFYEQAELLDGWWDDEESLVGHPIGYYNTEPHICQVISFSTRKVI